MQRKTIILHKRRMNRRGIGSGSPLTRLWKRVSVWRLRLKHTPLLVVELRLIS